MHMHTHMQAENSEPILGDLEDLILDVDDVYVLRYTCMYSDILACKYIYAHTQAKNSEPILDDLEDLIQDVDDDSDIETAQLINTQQINKQHGDPNQTQTQTQTRQQQAGTHISGSKKGGSVCSKDGEQHVREEGRGEQNLDVRSEGSDLDVTDILELEKNVPIRQVCVRVYIYIYIYIYTYIGIYIHI
jgi:hypothetical protein